MSWKERNLQAEFKRELKMRKNPFLPLVYLLLMAVACVKAEQLPQASGLRFLSGANYYRAEAAPASLDGLTFSTSGAWSAAVNYSGEAGWLSVEPSSGKQAGTHTVTLSLRGNTSGISRCATVVIRSGDAPQLSVKVEQESLQRIDTDALSITSPKLGTSLANPLVDYCFTADPTAVEHDGRLYVYGTNDHQQYEDAESNTYEKIKTLVVISTDDMVNWTFHGLIPVGEIAPWISASWAPSVVCGKKSDGKPLFSLYFSNSGWGVGVLEADSPVGPWRSPLSGSLIDGNNETVKGSGNIFDPGAVIDDAGTGWLSFGGTQGWLAKLNPDMHSFDGEPVKLTSPFHFEANELNYIGGTYVYTYNTNWADHSPWTWGGTAPGACSMVCFKSTDPLSVDSWTYGGMYFKNPGYNGLGYGNNHTHLHKFRGKWYLLYHTGTLQDSFGTDGGFRCLYASEIEVDEKTATIGECIPTTKGVSAIGNPDPYVVRLASTASATQGVVFNETTEAGHMTAAVGSPVKGASAPVAGIIEVRNVDFGTGASSVTCSVRGEGLLSFRLDSWDGTDIATVAVSGSAWHEKSFTLFSPVSGVHTLYMVLENGVEADTWQFRRQ